METEQVVRARKIFNGYQQTLIKTIHLLPFGAADALLPHPRDEIRQAIRVLARQMIFGGIEADIHHEDLRTAYQSLASFVSYEDANVAARLHHALERNEFAFLASSDAEAARNVSRQIENEAARLTSEFDAWVNETSDPMLTEVNTVLIDFERRRAAGRH